MFEKLGQFFVMLYIDFFYLILLAVLVLSVTVVLLILRHLRNKEEEKLQMQEDFKQQSLESLTEEEIDNISNNSADPEEVKQYLETEIDEAKKTAKKRKKQQEESKAKKPTLGIKKPKSKTQNTEDETAVTQEEPTETVEQTSQKRQYTGKWKIVEDDEGFYAILTASNGGTLLKTEKYKSISNVRSGIETVKKNIDMGNFAISVDKNGNYRYKLFNSSNRLICVSDTYSSKAKCEHGIESVKRFSQSATIILEDK